MNPRAEKRTIYEGDWGIVTVPQTFNPSSDIDLPLDIHIAQFAQSRILHDASATQREPEGSEQAWLPQLLSRLWAIALFAVSLTDREAYRFAKRCNAVHSASELPIAWHPSQAKLAVATSTSGVQLFDIRPTLARHGASSRRLAYSKTTPSAISRLSSPTTELRHDSQRAIHCIAWRPMARDMLVVASSGGVCLWREVNARVSAASYSQLMSKNGHVAAGPSAWLPTFLAVDDNARHPVTCVSWHPKGELLVGGRLSDSALLLWDVKTPGRCERRRASMAVGIHMLRWSPCGCYLFAGCVDGTFMVYETNTWEWRVWSHRACGSLVDAVWSVTASPPALLLVCSRQIVAFHLTDEAPGLDAQLMPLDAPQIFNPHVSPAASTAQSRRGEPSTPRAASEDAEGASEPGDAKSGSVAQVVDAVAWDSKRERLVIGLTGSHPLAGNALLYVTSQQPVMSALCVGPIYLPKPSETSAAARSDAPSSSVKRLAMHSADQATLLAVRSSADTVAVVPLALRGVSNYSSVTPATSRGSAFVE